MSIYDEIKAERERQDAQWGGPEHDDRHAPIEWSSYRARFERRGGQGASRRANLVKIAALAVAEIESIDRRAPDNAGRMKEGSENG